jgi:acetyltransferase-like isoleucine patch superfamily enzyme
MAMREKLRMLAERLERSALGSIRYYRRRGAKFGHVVVFSSPVLSEPHLCAFGNNVFVARDCLFLNHDGSVVMLNRMGLTPVVNIVGKIVVHDNVFIGLRCTVLLNVEIGPNAIVAAGSVVTKDVPPNTVVGGCPAKVICTLDDYLAKISADSNTLWIDREADITQEVVRHFMTEGQRGKKAIRLRHGGTPWTP